MGHWVHSEGDEPDPCCNGDAMYENDSGSDGGRSNGGTKRIKRACSYCHHKKGTPPLPFHLTLLISSTMFLPFHPPAKHF
jgi:hypothetical protein